MLQFVELCAGACHKTFTSRLHILTFEANKKKEKPNQPRSMCMLYVCTHSLTRSIYSAIDERKMLPFNALFNGFHSIWIYFKDTEICVPLIPVANTNGCKLKHEHSKSAGEI